MFEIAIFLIKKQKLKNWLTGLYMTMSTLSTLSSTDVSENVSELLQTLPTIVYRSARDRSFVNFCLAKYIDERLLCEIERRIIQFWKDVVLTLICTSQQQVRYFGSSS